MNWKMLGKILSTVLLGVVLFLAIFSSNTKILTTVVIGCLVIVVIDLLIGRKKN